MTSQKGPHSVENRIFSRIVGHRGGWAFTPSDFSDLGHPEAVKSALKRLASSSKIDRISRGLYHHAKNHATLGPLSPAIDKVADAIKRDMGLRLQPSGAYAANLLGLSEQVPMKVIFLTDGPNKILHIGKQQIVFQNTTTRNMACAGRFSGLLIQALRSLGKDHIDMAALETIARKLSHDDKKRLLEDSRYAPAWIAKIMRHLAQSPGEQ